MFASASVSDFEYHKVEQRRSYRLMYNVAVRLAGAVVVQTDEQVTLCERTFRRKAMLIRSVAAPAPPQDHAPLAFLWVGRLVWYKRPLEYVALARALPEATFWMVGVPSSGTHDDESGLAETVASQAQGVANLELLDPRPHSEIGELMARAVASVNTAEFEGMPNVLLEAWRRGVPALVLHHDPSGVIERYGLGDFAKGSRERLIELARRQWHERTDRTHVSERCRKYIRTYHEPERVAEQWLRLLGTSSSHQASATTRDTQTICAA